MLMAIRVWREDPKSSERDSVPTRKEANAELFSKVQAHLQFAKPSRIETDTRGDFANR